MISFLCSHCGAQLRIKPEFAGSSGKCPRCGKPIEAPDADAAAPARSSGSRQQSSTRGVRPTFETVASGRDQALDFLAPPQAPDELGRLKGYRVLKILGQGGMGLVLQAEDVKLKRTVALKVMRKKQAAQGENRVRFLRETQAAAAVEHDHIVPIYAVDEEGGVPFIAMKLLLGESLEDRLNREGKLPTEEVIRIGKEIALGLAAAHEQGLIHRDIKPANIWLEEGTGRVKIVDFGLALACDDDVKLTQDNYLVGTPMYMSPEQADGERELDARSDLFSLGSVLYRCATGALPFKGKNTMQVLHSLATKKPARPEELNPDIPPALADAIMSLLQKDPDDRVATARKAVVLMDEVAEAPSGYEEVEEDIVEDVEIEEKEKPREDRPRRKRKRSSKRDRLDETPEERLGRRVILFGIIAAIAVFLLLGALIVQRNFFH